jgi:SAM-dependent methyltransferase
MMGHMVANELERRRWNDDAWLEGWLRREALTTPVAEDLLRHLDPAAGQRVLDVGAGGGRTTLAIAAAVAPGGEAVGADISEALVDLARQRAIEAGVENARFVVADVQEGPVDGGPFDAAVSQFGVMFFDSPVLAFTNIRTQLVPGGRLSFACWQSVDRNPWFAGPAVASVTGPPPLPPSGRPTGPFSLADPEATTGLLADAGWADISVHNYERTITVSRETIVDDAQLVFFGVPEELVDQARAAVDERLAPLGRADGRYDAPLAYQVFTATA